VVRALTCSDSFFHHSRDQAAMKAGFLQPCPNGPGAPQVTIGEQLTLFE
jgi:hypothetical protein